jgi:short-subunit dehydrogenase
MAVPNQQTPRPRALVTGASSGIGRVFARRLACDGSDLILVGRREERLTELSRQIEKDGASAEVIVADLGTPHGLAAVEGRAAAGDLAMLINNAGFQTYAPFVELDPERAEAVEPIFARLRDHPLAAERIHDPGFGVSFAKYSRSASVIIGIPASSARI